MKNRYHICLITAHKALNRDLKIANLIIAPYNCPTILPFKWWSRKNMIQLNDWAGKAILWNTENVKSMSL